MTEERTPTERIREVLRRIANLDIDRDLVRSRELGELNFTDHRELFEGVISFSLQSADLPWEDTPQNVQHNIANQADSLFSTVDSVRNFSLTNLGANPSEERDRIAINLQNQYDSFRQSIIPLIGYLSWSSIDIERYRQELSNVVEEMRESVRTSLEELEGFSTEAQQRLAAIREAAAEQGVSQEAMTFRRAADRYTLSTRYWLWAAIAMGLATIGAGVAIVQFWGIDGQISDAGTLQHILARAAALAVLVYGTVTAVRLYRSNAHLAAVNRHREDALRTFRSFVEGADSEDTKDQVLLAAARAAFGQVPTGLVTDKGDGASVLEVLSGIGSNLTRR